MPCQQPSLDLYLWSVLIVVSLGENGSWLNTKQFRWTRWSPNESMAVCVQLTGLRCASKVCCVCVQSFCCVWLCNLMDYSPPGFSVHGVLIPWFGERDSTPANSPALTSKLAVSLNLIYCPVLFAFNWWTCFDLILITSYKHEKFPLSLFVLS